MRESFRRQIESEQAARKERIIEEDAAFWETLALGYAQIEKDREVRLYVAPSKVPQEAPKKHVFDMYDAQRIVASVIRADAFAAGSLLADMRNLRTWGSKRRNIMWVVRTVVVEPTGHQEGGWTHFEEGHGHGPGSAYMPEYWVITPGYTTNHFLNGKGEITLGTTVEGGKVPRILGIVSNSMLVPDNSAMGLAASLTSGMPPENAPIVKEWSDDFAKTVADNTPREILMPDS